MRVIITGGTGLIGRALARRLSDRGDEVVILTRRPDRPVQPNATGRLVGWDAMTASGWSSLIDGNTAIVNLAGASIAGGRWSADRKRRIRDSRVNAGQAVVAAVAAASARPLVVIQASAVGYYGSGMVGDVDETTPSGTDFLAQVCVDWERSTEAVEVAGVRRVIVRTGVVLAREGGALPRLALPYRFFVGGPLGSGQQPVPWIHLDDEVSAIVFLLDHPSASGAFNLAGPRPIDNAELARILGKVLGRPSLLRVPAIALRLALGEMATVVLDGQSAVPGRLLDAGFRFAFSDAETALRDLSPRT